MYKKQKKADLAISTVVIVILSLVVLFVLLFIFGKQSAVFRFNLNDCESKQGNCMSAAACTEQKGQTIALSCGKTSPLKSAESSSDSAAAEEDVCCYLSCQSQKGECKTKAECPSKSGNINYVLYTNCDNDGKICCLAS